MADKVEYKGLGRRKKSVAKVKMVNGNGKIIINERELNDYFPSSLIRKDMEQPLDVTNTKKIFDIYVRVSGGGLNGQAGAIRLAISRALIQVNPDYKPILKKAGLTTRDARVKERKKYGLYGARRSPQFTKR